MSFLISLSLAKPLNQSPSNHLHDGNANHITTEHDDDDDDDDGEYYNHPIDIINITSLSTYRQHHCSSTTKLGTMRFGFGFIDIDIECI
jgi:hypothetical protein